MTKIRELKNFNKELANKPHLVCRTKSDLKQELSEQWDEFEEEFFDISSVTKEGISELIFSLAELLNK